MNIFLWYIAIGVVVSYINFKLLNENNIEEDETITKSEITKGKELVKKNPFLFILIMTLFWLPGTLAGLYEKITKKRTL